MYRSFTQTVKSRIDKGEALRAVSILLGTQPSKHLPPRIIRHLSGCTSCERSFSDCAHRSPLKAFLTGRSPHSMRALQSIRRHILTRPLPRHTLSESRLFAMFVVAGSQELDLCHTSQHGRSRSLSLRKAHAPSHLHSRNLALHSRNTRNIVVVHA